MEVAEMTHARYEYPQRMPIFSPPLAVLLGLAPAPITPRGVIRHPHRCKDSYVEPGQVGVICIRCGDEHAKEYVSKGGVCKSCRSEASNSKKVLAQKQRRAINNPVVLRDKLSAAMFNVVEKPMTVAEATTAMGLTSSDSDRRKIGKRLQAAVIAGVLKMTKINIRNRATSVYFRPGHESLLDTNVTIDQQTVLSVLSNTPMLISDIAELVPMAAGSLVLHRDRVRYHLERLVESRLAERKTVAQKAGVTGPPTALAFRAINRVP